jgi:mRNA-degrading endonuclease RelE of RelBE toxin-antitoxin system
VWKIEFTKSATKELLRSSKNIQISIKRAICEKLAAKPYKFKLLKDIWRNCFRMRVGDYRVIYEIKNH